MSACAAYTETQASASPPGPTLPQKQKSFKQQSASSTRRHSLVVTHFRYPEKICSWWYQDPSLHSVTGSSSVSASAGLCRTLFSVGAGLVGNAVVGDGFVGDGLVGAGVMGDALVGAGVMGDALVGEGVVGDGVTDFSG